MVSVCIWNPKYIKYQANFFSLPTALWQSRERKLRQTKWFLSEYRWKWPANFPWSGWMCELQFCLLGYSACWNPPEWYTKFPPHILTVSHQGGDHGLQSIVLSVILSAWMCALKSIMCSTAIESFQLETGSVLWNSGLKVLCTWMDCVSIYLINLSNTMTQRPVNSKSLLCQNDHKK